MGAIAAASRAPHSADDDRDRHWHAEHDHQHGHRRHRHQGAGLLEKHLPKTGKVQGREVQVDWQNFTSGPPITNGMMANKIQSA
jgi:hypothetical protein